ncbi:MAG TPA: Spy/CpxP family protein refolding chaperone [Longimicrobiales bacterium]|nr:Spy/CpxP family protein refolding chaperone [Longimicrobiales bacterium]
MRKLLVFALAAGLFAGCGKDTTAPPASADDALSAATLAGGAGLGDGPGVHGVGFLRALPPELKLSADQQARIKALREAFQQANKADLDALRAIMKQARDARKGGQTRDQLRQVLEQARPIHERLAPAVQKLRTDIEAVLTPAQKDWLAAHGPGRCTAAGAQPLSDAQKAQIRSLRQAFQQANKADLEALRGIMTQAREARQAGKSRDEVRQILEQAKPIHQRLAPAFQKLRADMLAVLTPEQRASGCLRFFRGPGGGARRSFGQPGAAGQPHFFRGAASAGMQRFDVRA